MTIHFFTRGGYKDADSRQRAFQIAEKLNLRGLTAVVHQPPALLMSTTPWPRKFFLIIELFRSLSTIRKGDVVYLQRTISNKYFFVITVVYLVLFRPKMIFDFCDPVYVVNFFKTKVLTRMADAVIVSSHKQVVWAKQYNQNVHLIHISLDTAIYRKFTKDYSVKNGPLVIGWLGTAHNHMFNLEIIAGAFRKLLKKTSVPFAFVLIGAFKNQKVYDMFHQIEGLNVRLVDNLDYADPESSPREIQKFDIGVIPQINVTEWNKAKTSMKILEYMACGVASVASASGELPYIIQDGKNGFIADTEDDWVEKLALLLEDSTLCERLGRAGQKTVEEGYSFDAIIPRMIEIIKKVEIS